eukprot:1998476-Amphidinium_carterae.2
MPTENVYQAPLSTSERKTERAVQASSERAAPPQVAPAATAASAASAAVPRVPPMEALNEKTGDLFVARWLKANGIRSSLIREVHATCPLPIDLTDYPETAEAEPTVADAQEVVKVEDDQHMKSEQHSKMRSCLKEMQKKTKNQSCLLMTFAVFLKKPIKMFKQNEMRKARNDRKNVPEKNMRRADLRRPRKCTISLIQHLLGRQQDHDDDDEDEDDDDDDDDDEGQIILLTSLEGCLHHHDS